MASLACQVHIRLLEWLARLERQAHIGVHVGGLVSQFWGRLARLVRHVHLACIPLRPLHPDDVGVLHAIAAALASASSTAACRAGSIISPGTWFSFRRRAMFQAWAAIRSASRGTPLLAR